MKLRIAVAAVCALVLAIPVVASSNFRDVNDKHATAVAYVSGNGMLPPDSRARSNSYGARYYISDTDIVNAIRAFERMEGERLRREEFASFLLAGVQKVRNLNKPTTTTTTTTTTRPTTTTTKPSNRIVRTGRGDGYIRITLTSGIWNVSLSYTNARDVDLTTIRSPRGSNLNLVILVGTTNPEATTVDLDAGEYWFEVSNHGPRGNWTVTFTRLSS